jgi:hypothetical protein
MDRLFSTQLSSTFISWRNEAVEARPGSRADALKRAAQEDGLELDMQQRKLFTVSIVAALVLWIVFPWPGGVSRAIAEKIRAGTATVDIATLTPFMWDEMFLFGPYQTRERICARLRLDGIRCWWIVPAAIDEGHYFFAFRSGGDIVHHEHHPRSNGDFSRSRVPQPIIRAQAMFTVRKDGTRFELLFRVPAAEF